VALAWAAVDERHHHIVQGRVGSVRDVAIDAIGVVVALALLRLTPLGRRVGVRSRRRG
jgi:VanZ family protein